MRHFVQDVMSGYGDKGVGSFDILGLHDEPTIAGVVSAAKMPTPPQEIYVV